MIVFAFEVELSKCRENILNIAGRRIQQIVYKKFKIQLK